MKALVILLSVAHLLSSFSVACPGKFKNSSEFMALATQCIKKLNLSMEDLQKGLEKLKDGESDDMVYSELYFPFLGFF